MLLREGSASQPITCRKGRWQIWAFCRESLMSLRFDKLDAVKTEAFESELAEAGGREAGGGGEMEEEEEEKEEKEEKEEEEEEADLEDRESSTFTIDPQISGEDESDGDVCPLIDDDPESSTPEESAEPHPPLSLWKRLAGISFLLISAFCFSLMGLLVSMLLKMNPESGILWFEMILVCPLVVYLFYLVYIYIEFQIRGVFQVIPVAFYQLLIERKSLLGPSDQRVWLSLRGILGVVSLGCYYWSLMLLSVSEAAFLIATTPIWTGLLAYVLLKESYSKWDALGAIASCVGIIFIAHPDFIFGSLVSRDASSTPSSTSASFQSVMGVMAALASAVVGGLVYCLIRKIGDSTDPSILVFYWGFFALIAFIPFRLLSSQPLVIPQTFVEGLMMAGVGLTSLAAQYFFNKGVQLEKAAIASVVRNSSAIYSLIFQVTILEIPKGFLLSLFGGLLILVVIVGSSIQKFRSA